MACFILTHGGRHVQFEAFDPACIDIEDIAHALSMVCRFAGHCPRHYSVAQHSMLVADLVSEEYKLAALLHDASEAYLGDVTSPLKRNEQMRGYRELEKSIQSSIDTHYGIDSHTAAVKEADLRALYIEGRSFWSTEEMAGWGFDQAIIDWAKTSRQTVWPHAPAPEVLKRQFLGYFERFGGKAAEAQA